MRYENEKAPAGVAALAEAWKDDFAVNHSVPNFITSVGKSLHIFELLQTGAENGVTLRELVALTGMNERLVRFKIQQERKAGKLILSNNRDGYFLPETPEDVQRFARSMSQAGQRKFPASQRAAETALADLTDQAQIAGWNDG